MPNGKGADQVWDFVKSLEMKGVTINPAQWAGGPGGHAGAARWRQQFEAHANADESSSPAIASGGGHATHVHTTIQLDGRTVAKNTAKHLSKMGNAPSHSAQMHDPYAAMPLNII